MSHKLKQKCLHYVAMLLISVMVIMSMGAQRLPLSSAVSPENQTPMMQSATPCQLAKIAVAHATRLCQSQVNADIILTSFFLFFSTMTGKLYFMVLAGLLTASHQRRIFKPPKALAFA